MRYLIGSVEVGKGDTGEDLLGDGEELFEVFPGRGRL
jgi:hypothetical protein